MTTHSSSPSGSEKLPGHTPGPWTPDRARPDGWLGPHWVVRASRPVYATTDVIAIVNTGPPDARLIAAAPDMAALLRDALSTLEHMTSIDYANGHDKPLRERLRALLAKIDGNSHES